MSIIENTHELDILIRTFCTKEGLHGSVLEGGVGVDAIYLPTRLCVRCDDTANVHLNKQRAVSRLHELLREQGLED